jgi:hypothetical protein
MDPDPIELKEAIEHETQSNAPIFSTADSSRIFNSSGKYDAMFAGRGRSSPGAITISMKGAVEKKVRPKSEMQKVFDKETDLYINRYSHRLLEEHTDIKKSASILSKEDLIGEKGMLE